MIMMIAIFCLFSSSPCRLCTLLFFLERLQNGLVVTIYFVGVTQHAMN